MRSSGSRSAPTASSPATRRSSNTSSTSSKTTNRVKFEELGKTTMGNPYVLATISAPENLAKLTRLVEINRRLADPRGLSEAEAKRLAQEGRAFYFVYGTIHSTEVGNTQSLIEIAHRLATDGSPEIKQILDNVVVLLVPSQNPDGQYLVVDHWYKTKGTPFTRTYPGPVPQVRRPRRQPRLVHVHAEGNAARDREGPEQRYKPIITHDMHQKGSGGARIFVPPFDDPYDPNVHPILAQGIMTRSARRWRRRWSSEGKGGVEWLSRYDLWAPARQYMVYHGQPRILTEIASVNLADPLVNRERRADGAAGGALELPAAVPQERLAAARHRRLRQHRRVRRAWRTSRSTGRRGSRTSTASTPTG